MIGSDKTICTVFADDNKKYLKMLIRLEDSLARCFFVKNVLVVEGDTEYVAINETLKFVSEETRSRILSDWFILRAHGKPIIISIVKYFFSLYYWFNSCFYVSKFFYCIFE